MYMSSILYNIGVVYYMYYVLYVNSSNISNKLQIFLDTGTKRLKSSLTVSDHGFCCPPHLGTRDIKKYKKSLCKIWGFGYVYMKTLI